MVPARIPRRNEKIKFNIDYKILQNIYKFLLFKLSMEKRELGVLGIAIIGIVIIGFFGNFTGHAVNESNIECNIADFNGDGVVNFIDKEDFGEQFSLFPVNGDPCELLDFNNDGVISILDANDYNEFYTENYGVNTGRCILKRSSCEKDKPKIQSKSVAILPPIPEGGVIATQKPNFFQIIKNFFFRNILIIKISL